MLKREPIDRVLAKPTTDDDLRRKLSIIQQARLFAVETLKLPNNGSYTHYVDTGRPYVVWNVIATKAYSIQPIEHCFPVAGCVSYRGYFKKAAAEAYAAQLTLEGYDTTISGASAYSTLGWFSDPVLNTMLYRSDLALAGLVFHELSHQEVYQAGDTAFNESFATTVELAGVQAWFKAQKKRQDTKESKPPSRLFDEENLKRYREAKFKSAEVVKLILKYRQKLAVAYSKVDPQNTQQLAHVKKQGFSDLKAAYKALRARGGGSRGYDQWFDGPINNASLVLFGDYHGWVTAFDELLQQSEGDWARFYESVQALTALDKPERRLRLEALQRAAK